MPSIKYTYPVKDLDPVTTARARGLDLPISRKAAREVCAYIVGKRIPKAIEIMENVIALKQPIPYKRYNRNVPHRSQLKGWPAGRYPVKVCKYIKKILENLAQNAENKGLNPENMVIIHASVKKGPTLKKYIPRAFGRATPFFRETVHCEIIAEEIE